MGSSALAEDILAQIADAVIYADHHGVIRRWNHGAEAIFGHSAAEALGQNLDLIVPIDLRAAHWRGFGAAMAKGILELDGRPTLTRAVRKDGATIYVELSFALVHSGIGRGSLGAVAVARKVMRRKPEQPAVRELVS
jgi:PAS domain S-box-containing protein